MSTSRTASLGHTDLSVAGVQQDDGGAGGKAGGRHHHDEPPEPRRQPLKVIPPLGSSPPGRAVQRPAGRACSRCAQLPRVSASAWPSSARPSSTASRRPPRRRPSSGVTPSFWPSSRRPPSSWPPSSAPPRPARLTPGSPAPRRQVASAPGPLGPAAGGPAAGQPVDPRRIPPVEGGGPAEPPQDHCRAAQPAGSGRWPPTAGAHAWPATAGPPSSWTPSWPPSTAAAQPGVGRPGVGVVGARRAPGQAAGRRPAEPVGAAGRRVEPVQRLRERPGPGPADCPQREQVVVGRRHRARAQRRPQVQDPAPDPFISPTGSAVPSQGGLDPIRPPARVGGGHQGRGPATTAVDIEVPDPRKWWSPTRPTGWPGRWPSRGARGRPGRRPRPPGPAWPCRRNRSRGCSRPAPPRRRRIDRPDGDHIGVEPGSLDPRPRCRRRRPP